MASVATTSPSVPRDHSRTVTLVLFAVLAASFLGSFLIGPAEISPGALFAGLLDGHGAAGVIAQQIRLPRAALGSWWAPRWARAARRCRGCSAIRWPSPA